MAKHLQKWSLVAYCLSGHYINMAKNIMLKIEYPNIVSMIHIVLVHSNGKEAYTEGSILVNFFKCIFINYIATIMS